MSTQTIDLTPTWAGLMPGIIAALQNGTPQGQKIAREELDKLARGMDAANAANAATGPQDAADVPLDPRGATTARLHTIGGLVALRIGDGETAYLNWHLGERLAAELVTASQQCREGWHYETTQIDIAEG